MQVIALCVIGDVNSSSPTSAILRRQLYNNQSYCWWSGIVVSMLASINEVNLRRARLVRRWATISVFIPDAGHLFRYVTNSAFHPYGVGK